MPSRLSYVTDDFPIAPDPLSYPVYFATRVRCSLSATAPNDSQASTDA